MIEPEAQGAEVTLQELDAVLDVVYPAVEAAIQESREFFKEGDEIDRALFPNLVRYYIKTALSTRGLKTVEDDEPVLEHQILPNNGLLLDYGARTIRIRKADNGGLPVAASKRMQEFYEQLSLLTEAIEHQNLVLLWDLVDGVVELQLVCPKDKGASVHWLTPVPHPAQAHEAIPVGGDEPFDLPISLPEAASADD